MQKPKGFDSNYDKYREYLESNEWDKLRNARLIKDNFRCAICGKAEQLHVHHIFYPNEYGDENINDVITLCDTCHGLVEKLKKEGRYTSRWQVFNFEMIVDVTMTDHEYDSVFFLNLPKGELKVRLFLFDGKNTYKRLLETNLTGLRAIQDKYKDAVDVYFEKH